MLSVFPDLLAFGLVAPLLLRLSLGVLFLEFGWKKLAGDREKKTAFFETLGLRPGAYYAVGFGTLEVVCGLMLIVGLYTQVAALIALAISGSAYALKKKYPEHFKNDRYFFFLLVVISFSLLFSGAGFLAFDLPL